MVKQPVSNKKVQETLLIEAVKRYREAEGNGSEPMRLWHHQNMHRMAYEFDLKGFLKDLLNV